MFTILSRSKGQILKHIYICVTYFKTAVYLICTGYLFKDISCPICNKYVSEKHQYQNGGRHFVDLQISQYGLIKDLLTFTQFYSLCTKVVNKLIL